MIAIAVALWLPVLAAGPVRGAPRSKTIGKESPAKQDGEQKIEKEWEAPYGGVTPGGGIAPPEQKRPPSGLQAITWTGFRLLPEGGGSEVFLQLTGSVTHQEKRKGSRILITLEKTVVPLRNNLRPVIAQSFRGTPVDRFRIRLVGKDQARLEIRLKRKSTHSVALRTQGQYSYLVVSFPPVARAR
jgi:hypothetical protein